MKENKEYLVRIGRVSWWGALAIAGIATLLGVAQVLVTIFSDRGPGFDELPLLIVVAGIALLLGRGMRYVLANE
jgi:hypothetical protein